MRRLSRRARVLGLCALVGASTACHEIPGEVVGTFKITVKLRENNCGAAAVYTNDGRTYSVELREESATNKAYWHVPKDPPLSGTYEGDSFTFMAQSIVASEMTDAGTAGCVLGQTEVLEGRFMRDSDAGDSDAGVASEPSEDAGATDTGDASDDAALTHALEATHTLTIEPATSASCANALLPAGAFEKFPCTVIYDLTGTRRGAL